VFCIAWLATHTLDDTVKFLGISDQVGTTPLLKRPFGKQQLLRKVIITSKRYVIPRQTETARVLARMAQANECALPEGVLKSKEGVLPGSLIEVSTQ